MEAVISDKFRVYLSKCENIRKVSPLERPFQCENFSIPQHGNTNKVINILKKAIEGHSGSKSYKDNVRSMVMKEALNDEIYVPFIIINKITSASLRINSYRVSYER